MAGTGMFFPLTKLTFSLADIRVLIKHPGRYYKDGSCLWQISNYLHDDNKEIYEIFPIYRIREQQSNS